MRDISHLSFFQTPVRDTLHRVVAVTDLHPRQVGHTLSLLPPCILNLPQTPRLASPSDRLVPLV